MAATSHTTSLHRSLTSFCKKTFLPFSFTKKRQLPAVELRLSRQQSENLKWQQDSFHRMLNLMGLCKEGILGESDVTAFRIHLLETLIAAPLNNEPPDILTDKLVFLQELLYARCISEEEYHASKRPLLQRLAVQGAEIDARDVIVGGCNHTSEEGWSSIDLRDEISLCSQWTPALENNKHKKISTTEKIKGLVSVLGFEASLKVIDASVHSQEKKSCPPECETTKNLRSQPEGQGGSCNDNRLDPELKIWKKAGIIDRIRKLRKHDCVAEAAQLSCNENNMEITDGYLGKLVENPVAEGCDTKQIKRKLHPDGAPNDFFVDKVLGENIIKKLSQIKRDHKSHQLTDEQIETISTRLPVDKQDLRSMFSSAWCDDYGDIVLNVVLKEFKEHMKEMGSRSRRCKQHIKEQCIPA